MSKGQMLRALVKQRLSLAAEEIFDLFERTIAEYEEQLCRSKEENERQRKLLDAVFKPQLRLHRADVQQMMEGKEEVPPEQQDWSSSLDQQDPPELPHVKKEKEELWTDHEEADITEFTFTPVPVKSEDDDEEKPQSSQLLQVQTEQMETEADTIYHSLLTDGEDCGGPEPARISDPDGRLQPETEDQNNSGVSLGDVGLCPGEKPFSCSECGRRFRHRGHLQIHLRCHTGEKPFSCSICGKCFPRKENLVRHSRFHSGEKPFSCSFCQKHFTRSDHAVTHMRIHTGEKPFRCSVCGKSFTHKLSLKHHMTLHTEERAFSCNVCNNTFTRQSHVSSHKCKTVEQQLVQTDPDMFEMRTSE